MTLCWRELAHFEDLHQVSFVLNVAAVMPSEDVRLFTVDQVRHGVNPAWVLQCCQTPVLCILNNLEDVTTFERVTVKAYAARDLLELAASLAFFGR